MSVMEKSMKMRHSHNRILFTCNLNQYLKKRLQRASVLKVNKMVIGHKIYICLQSVTILQLYYFPWSGHPINILYRISYKHDVEQWCDKGTAEYKWPVYVEGRKVVNGTKNADLDKDDLIILVNIQYIILFFSGKQNIAYQHQRGHFMNYGRGSNTVWDFRSL